MLRLSQRCVTNELRVRLNCSAHLLDNSADHSRETPRLLENEFSVWLLDFEGWTSKAASYSSATEELATHETVPGNILLASAESTDSSFTPLRPFRVPVNSLTGVTLTPVDKGFTHDQHLGKVSS